MYHKCPLVIACIMLLVLAAYAAVADTGLARHKKMFVVPAPGPVKIDGDLTDWDLSGQITMYVVSETADMQSAKFALMYDKDNLYVSAVVRDPTPMMNRHDPKVDPAKSWNADSCQFRMSLDPKKPYPINIGYGGPGWDDPTILNLTLWDYTDRSEPCLQIQQSMGLKTPNSDWGPGGVVPDNLFQGKYVKMADGRGYTFEYAIPWSTLGAKAPLKGGDLVAGTVQFNWSAPDGLTTGGGASWAYDLMGAPGFPYQSTACWGKMIFSPTGCIARNLVEAGVPPEKPLPLKFAYTLPEDSQITIQLVDKDHFVRRILVPQGNRPAGKNVELWDGLDDQGKPLPASTYKWEGIYHKPLTQKFLFSPDNSGQPPYATDDGTGGWGGDESNPQDVCAVNGGVIMCWDAAEAGWGIIRTDLTGKKLKGTKTAAQFVASDGTHVFTAGDHGFDQNLGVRLFDASDLHPLNFANGDRALSAPAGGDKDSNTVSGLAYGAGNVYVSYRARNLVGIFDAASGALKSTCSVPSPGRLAARADGSVVVITGNGVAVVSKDGAVSAFASAHLDSPTGIAAETDGSVYVANSGAMQDVSVFDQRGAYQRTIGKVGGRPRVGNYDRNGILEPGGIAIDANGHLWTAETLDFPRRVSEWDAKTGAFVNEFFGSCDYFGYSYIDPRKPNEIYCHNVLWKIDWKNNTCEPVSTIWRPSTPNMMWAMGPSGYIDHPIFFTAKNGKQYAYGYSGWTTDVISKRDGDIYKPFAAVFQINRNSAAYEGQVGGTVGAGAKTQFPVLDDAGKFPDGTYLWQDKNDDQTVQADEVTRLPDKVTYAGVIDPDLNIYISDGILKPLRIQGNGQPIYDGTVVKSPYSPRGASWLDDDNAGAFTYNAYSPPDLYFAKWAPGGVMEWAFPGMRPWESSLSYPMQAPGHLWGMTVPLGIAGQFTGMADYFNVYHIFTRDGIYVGMLMRDSRDGKGLGPDVTASETNTGELVKPDGMNRYFLLAGAGDARVTEIFGLDTVKSLPGGTLDLSDADVKLAAHALADYTAQLSHSKPLSIARGEDGLSTAEPVSKTLDASRSFSARAAYDSTNLYVSFDVTAPNDLINSEPDPTIVFKGGNALDIQIATDSSADPKRALSAPGDMRILVTRQVPATGGDPAPLVVVYRPKVAGFTGTPRVLNSPTGHESFDSIEVSHDVTVNYTKTAGGYTSVVTIPRSMLNMDFKSGQEIKMDLGVIYGNATGNQTSARSYWSNDGFSANVTNDVPNESRLEPALWGPAVVE